MGIPALVDWADRSRGYVDFLSVATLVTLSGGLVFVAMRGPSAQWKRREGILFVNAAWLSMSLAGAIPLYLSDLDIGFTDAFFESASGLTTTGSTVLSGLDSMDRGILMWRSMLQWFGGIGFVVLATFLLPVIGSGGQQLFTLESSDTAEKPFARFRQYAVHIAILYLAVTAFCFAVYLALGMNAFDAINHAFTTVSTGGYSTSDSSMGKFQSEPVLWASSFFMLISSLPFIYLIQIVFARQHRLEPQIACYLSTLAVSVALLMLIISWRDVETQFDPLVTTVFHVLAVVTTTGYAAEDYTLWHSSVAAVFFLITFLGGCSGSTSGGFKAYRMVVVAQTIRQHVWRVMYPRWSGSARYGAQRLSSRDTADAMTFAFLYFSTFAVVATALQVIGLDVATSVSASATAIANVGPGLGEIIGPAGNFSTLPVSAKWILVFAMIAGRLEMMVVYVLALSAFWRW
ncbi:TrkH family potassium uptake protein [Pararhizobium haloflavum]|uniref:TrkH family potassium uptake protein n=1 Tax=Pararhizobium haloflavum TaxID=2037914 RepID=UPI0018E49780|nr:TrkH family potassium uptake protein [Pararhizobium haloflavum]